MRKLATVAKGYVASFKREMASHERKIPANACVVHAVLYTTPTLSSLVVGVTAFACHLIQALGPNPRQQINHERKPAVDAFVWRASHLSTTAAPKEKVCSH